MHHHKHRPIFFFNSMNQRWTHISRSFLSFYQHFIVAFRYIIAAAFRSLPSSSEMLTFYSFCSAEGITCCVWNTLRIPEFLWDLRHSSRTTIRNWTRQGETKTISNDTTRELRVYMMEHFWSFSVWPNAPEGYSSTRGAPLMHAQSLSSYSFNCMMAQALSNSLLDLTPLFKIWDFVKSGFHG